jgi:tetratricopeptide (TPR) repeat protein
MLHGLAAITLGADPTAFKLFAGDSRRFQIEGGRPLVIVCFRAGESPMALSNKVKIIASAIEAHRGTSCPRRMKTLTWMGIVLAALAVPRASAQQEDPSNREQIIGLAVTLAKQARKTEDQAKYNRVLALLAQVDAADNTDPWIPFWQGVAFRHLGRIAEASEKYQLADKLLPNNSDILNDWGLALDKLGEHEESLAVFLRAIDANGNNAWPYGNAGAVLRELGRHEDAVRYLQLAVMMNPLDSKARQHLGSSLAELGRHQEALRHLRVAAQLDPKDAWTQWEIGYCLKAVGNCPETVAYFQNAADLAPQNPTYRFWLAQALQCSGRHKEAIEQAKAGLELDPNNSYGWASWGYSLGGLGCHCEAVSKLREALRLGSTHAEDRHELKKELTLCWGYRLVYALLAAVGLLVAVHLRRKWSGRTAANGAQP